MISASETKQNIHMMEVYFNCLLGDFQVMIQCGVN